MLPHSVLLSEAYLSLPAFAKISMIVLAAQFDGNNNGDLALTWGMGKTWGIKSHGQLTKSLSMLIEHGLIQRTRQGGKRPMGPTLYALAWHPIHHREHGFDPGVKPTASASFTYLSWPANGTAEGTEKARYRDRRGNSSGPPKGQRRPVSGPPRVQRAEKSACIGTAGGPPSITSQCIHDGEAPW